MIAWVVRLLFVATIHLRLSFRSIRIRGKVEKKLSFTQRSKAKRSQIDGRESAVNARIPLIWPKEENTAVRIWQRRDPAVGMPANDSELNASPAGTCQETLIPEQLIDRTGLLWSSRNRCKPNTCHDTRYRNPLRYIEEETRRVK